MYKLLHLASAGFVPNRSSLAFLCEKFLGVELKKDERRENFGQFLGAQISDIPEEYLEYGALDVIVTYKVYKKLEEYIARHDTYGTLLSHSIQVKGDLALLHIYKNGIGFDLERKGIFLEEKEKELYLLEKKLGDWGLVRGQKGYKEMYKHIIENLLNLPVPYRYKKLLVTNKEDSWYFAESGFIEINGNKIRVQEGDFVEGDPSLSSQREDLEVYYNTHSFVKDFLDFMELEKTISFVKDINTTVLNPRYTTLLNTGRTSCSNPNIQQLPRDGQIRNFFIPKKKNNIFGIVDYSSIELAGLSQVCLKEVGFSKMGDLINEGKCLHYHTATSIFGKPQDKILKEERQFSKIPNFGFSANMSPTTFIKYCKGYGVNITEERSAFVKDVWLRTYPEMIEFFKIGQQTSVYTLTGRKRANCSYTAFLNTKFQGICSDGLKLALYELDKAGFEIVLECHDEIVCEFRKDEAEKKLEQMKHIMIESMKKVIPDIRIGVEGGLHEFYTK